MRLVPPRPRTTTSGASDGRCRLLRMSEAQRVVIRELATMADNDALRGGATRDLLAVRQAAVREAEAARETYAYRQALLELAACAVGLAARMPAPAGPLPRVARGSERRGDAASPGVAAGHGRTGGSRRAA